MPHGRAGLKNQAIGWRLAGLVGLLVFAWLDGAQRAAAQVVTSEGLGGSPFIYPSIAGMSNSGAVIDDAGLVDGSNLGLGKITAYASFPNRALDPRNDVSLRLPIRPAPTCFIQPGRRTPGAASAEP